MARYRTYENLAPRVRHLLIASQGAHSPGSRRLTYLEIERSDAHDHRLTAAEIAGFPIAAELVTLAACDTAYAEALLSDERLDLTRAFLVAGAASVLATRWKVPEDYRTSRFLVDFYRAYRQGGPDGRGLRKDQALTEARRRSRERGDPAQIWAAWVLVGDAQ
jgi:CHAT domain-containing protein